MTPDDPDSAPERPETVPEQPPLAAADQRAVEVAVAGAAGFLLGRVLFGNAGGMAAGLLAAGAGLLMKHLSHGKNGEAASPALEPEPSAPPPAESPGVHEDFDVAGVREVFEGTGFSAGSPAGEAAPPLASFSDSDAGVFAEEPAWFEPPEKEAAASRVESNGRVPVPDLEGISFDDNPEPVRVELLPVVPPVEETPVKEVLPEENALRPYPNGQIPPVPVMEAAATGAVPELPAEFTALREEEEPGPREEFLIIPDEPSSYPPPLQPVVAELNRLLERSFPPEPPAREVLTAGVPVAEQPVPGPPATEPWTMEPPVPEQSAQPVPANEEALREPAAEFHIPELPPLVPPAMKTPAPVERPAVEPWAMEIPVREEPEPMAPPVPMAMPELPPVAPVASVPLSDLTPAPAPVMPATEEKVEIPSNPEEIWRQAAVELAAMRSAPPVPAEEESPWAAMLAQAPAPAPPRPPAGLSTPPPLSPPKPTPAGPEEIPPWLRDIAYTETQEEPASPDPQRAFLAGGGLTMPVPLPPSSPQKPPPEPVFAPANPGMTRPIPAVPSDALLDLDAPIPAVPPIPVAPIPITSATPAAGEAPRPAHSQPLRGPVPGTAGGGAAADEEKLFVPRVRSRRNEPAPRGRSVVTPFRVAVLALIAAGALAMAFKPQLKALWEQKILGRPAKNAQTIPAKPVPATKNEPGAATDVKITDEDPLQPEAATPPKAPDAVPGKPGGESPKTTPAPEKPEAPAAPPPPEPPAAPPPSAAVEPPKPQPGETEARALISRLLQAKTAAEVKPFILNAERLGPAVDALFAAGKTTAATGHEITLTGAEKSGAQGRMVWSFKVTTDKVPSGFPVAVEDTPGGLRVDWEFLTQCRDERLRGFLNDPSAESADFYVSLVRTHPFPDMLPEQDLQNFIPFTVASPSVGSARTNVFIRKGTLLGTKADGLYQWGVEYAPIVTLAHKDGHVEITGVPRENWRTAGQLRIGGVRGAPKNERDKRSYP